MIPTLGNSSTYYGSWMVDHFCICRRLCFGWLPEWSVAFVSYLCGWKFGWLAGCLYYWLILTIFMYWEYLTTWLWEKEMSCSGLEWWWMAGPRGGLLSANLILGIWIWHQAYHYWAQCYIQVRYTPNCMHISSFPVVWKGEKGEYVGGEKDGISGRWNRWQSGCLKKMVIWMVK